MKNRICELPKLVVRIGAFALPLVLGSWEATASNRTVPPTPLANYYSQKASLSVANVELRQGFDASSGKVILQVVYYDSPRSPFLASDQIAVWIRINDREGSFWLERAGPDVTGSRSGWAVNLSNLEYSCTPGGGRGSSCLEPSPQMRRVFERAKTAQGRLSSWQVELAFVNGRGLWDNNNGTNFKFLFKQAQ